MRGGQHGPTRSRSCASGIRKLRTACSMTSPRPGVRRVCRLPLPRRCGSMRRVGLTVPAGKRALAGHPCHHRKGSSGWEALAGTLLSHFTLSFGSVSCCLPSLQLREHSYDPSPALRPACGSQPSPQTQQPPLTPTLCTWHCGAACGCPCL